MPHELDPVLLKEAFDKFRGSYRAWRTGGSKGSVGEVGDVTTTKFLPKAKETISVQKEAAPIPRSSAVERAFADMRMF